MKHQFVRTSNYSRFMDAVRAVEQRGAAEASMLLVFGNPGYGKSHMVESWAAETGAVFLRANVDWTPKYFLVELAKALRVDPIGTAEKLFNRLLGVIAVERIPLVIDEAESALKDNAAVLEKVRDFSDRTETLVVLVGMERIQTAIARHKQISSRIAQVVEFGPATLDDVAATCKQLAEIEIQPCLIKEIHAHSDGRMREVLNAIAAVERVAAVNAQKTMSVKDMDGLALTHDWQARRPRKVRAV